MVLFPVGTSQRSSQYPYPSGNATFNSQDAIHQSGSRRELEELETVDPGQTEWVRGELLKNLRDNPTSIKQRLPDYTENNFKGGPLTAGDFWADIWEPVTNGEPWPADLPTINPDRFTYLRTSPDE